MLLLIKHNTQPNHTESRHRSNLLLLLWFWHLQVAASMFLLPQPQPQTQPQSQQQQQQQQQALSQSQQQLLQAQLTSALENIVAPNSAGLNGTITPNSNQFVIKFFHNDSKNNLAYVSILPVNHTNMHEPRIELRYNSKYSFVSLDERTPNNTVVAVVVVSDDDPSDRPSGETSLSIESGNELGHFKLVSTPLTNTIQVNGAPLSKYRVPEYNLTIVARDHGTPPKSSSVNLVIKLNTSSSGWYSSAPLEPQPSLKPPVTDFMYVGLMLVVIFSSLILILIIGCALVQRPKGKKRPPPRTTSATNPRMHHSEHYPCAHLTNLQVAS